MLWQDGLSLTKFQTNSEFNLQFPSTYFIPSVDLETVDMHEGACNRLLFFPSDVPPVQLGLLIHSVFEKLHSVCLSCYCMCLVW